jgi:hypothetical protein
MMNQQTNREMAEAFLRATPWFFILLLPVIYYCIHQEQQKNEQKLNLRAMYNYDSLQLPGRNALGEYNLSVGDTFTYSSGGHSQE